LIAFDLSEIEGKPTVFLGGTTSSVFFISSIKDSVVLKKVRGAEAFSL
jgi:hypothetical protein